MEKCINKTLKTDDLRRLSDLIGKKITSLHHDEFTFGNISIQKVGIRTNGKIYSLETDYEYLSFLWGDEGVACLHFVETDEEGLIVKATPPIKYVDETINDFLVDIIVVRDEIEEFENDSSMGKFIYDKGVILVFEGHQIGIELDTWMEEMLRVFRSADALEKFTTLDFDWGNDDMEEGYRFESKRTAFSLKNFKATND